MDTTIKKSQITGSIIAPTSKSALQRYIAASMIAHGKSTIKFESISADAKHLLEIAAKLTGNAKIIGKTIEIQGGLRSNFTKINVGESGLGLRMIIPILCSLDSKFEVSGQGSLLARPIDFIVNSMRQIGVNINSNAGKLPITLQGPIKKNKFTIDGSLSSQLLSGLLLSAPLLNENIEIRVENLKSKPYIDLTISILEEFGVKITNQNYEQFLIGKSQKYQNINAYAEGDWSGSAFMLVAAALTGKLTITNILKNSKQGDKKIVDILKQVGAHIEQSLNTISITKNKLNAFEFDATDTPDLFPPLVALAVNCKGISKIKGVSRLIHKESNRAFTLKNEFEKLSAVIEIKDDYMMITGSKLIGTNVNSHNDHRIAMALAVAALTTNSPVVIEQSEAVAKSWPNFFETFSQIGAKVSLQNTHN